MDLTHRFEVPTPVPETWDHFNDIGALAECFPGAQVTSVEGDSFTGQAKVKLGPIALVYLGSGSIVERDESAKRMLVEAKGKDKRGNGTAGATVTLTMSEAPGSGTAVEVVTDLSITGKPAQFGRGVMQDVSDKLLGQFVACLEERLAAPDAEAPLGGGPATEPASETVADAPAGSTQSGSPRPSLPRPSPDESIDLGATVLPVLARTYWKQALGAIVVLLLLRRLLGRRG